MIDTGILDRSSAVLATMKRTRKNAGSHLKAWTHVCGAKNVTAELDAALNMASACGDEMMMDYFGPLWQLALRIDLGHATIDNDWEWPVNALELVVKRMKRIGCDKGDVSA